MKYKFLIYILLAISIFGCDNDKEEQNNLDSKYSGIWYLSESDNIIEISGNGELISYQCSLNGYTSIDHSGYSYKIEQDSIIQMFAGQEVDDSMFSTVELDGETLTIETTYLVDDQLSTTETFVLFDSIPDSCDSSALEITYISTTEVVEGELIEITIDFEYRLAEPTATIDVGFTSGDDGSYTITNSDLLNLTETVNGTDSVTFQFTPEILETSIQYYLHINMSPIDHSGSYSPLASDSKLLVIIPNT